MLRVFPVALLAFMLMSEPATARFVPFWPYERLLQEAEIVVIASVISSAPSKDKMADERWTGFDFLGVNTVFDVKSVLKGKIKGGNVTMLHYRMQAKSDAPETIIDGPSLVAFHVPKKATGNELFRPAYYLLYLKSRPDGRFETVTGQIDPIYSVRELRLPMPPEDR